MPDACTLISGDDIVRGVLLSNGGTASLWAGELSPYEKENLEYYKQSDSTCWWSLDPASKSGLGMDASASGERDVEVTIRRYGFHEWRVGGSAGPAWSDDDPATLVEEFFSAHQEQIGSNAIATRVPGEPAMVQDGSVVIVAGPTLWAEVTLFNCHFAVCGDPAVSLAKVVQETLAAVQ